MLFEKEKNDSTYIRVIYLMSVKSCISYTISHNYAKIKVDSWGSLPLEKEITFCDVMTLIKSVFNKDWNSYYYNIFLEKSSYEWPKNKFLYKI